MLRSHPAFQMVEVVVYFAQHDAQLSHVRLFVTLVKVLPESLSYA